MRDAVVQAARKFAALGQSLGMQQVAGCAARLYACPPFAPCTTPALTRAAPTCCLLLRWCTPPSPCVCVCVPVCVFVCLSVCVCGGWLVGWLRQGEESEYVLKATGLADYLIQVSTSRLPSPCLPCLPALRLPALLLHACPACACPASFAPPLLCMLSSCAAEQLSS